jgi:O-antigen ligase
MSTLAPPEPKGGRRRPDVAGALRSTAGARISDLLLAAGAGFVALAFSVAALQTLAIRPAILPAFFIAGLLFPLILTRPEWIVPIFLSVTWMSIGQSFFGGLAPVTLGSFVLLPLAAWYAQSRRGLAREALILAAMFGLPIIIAGILSIHGSTVDSGPMKDLAFLLIAALCIRTRMDGDRTALALVLTGIFLGAGAVFSVRVHPTALFPLDEAADIYGNPPTGAPRAAGPFGESNFFALSLAVLVPFCLYLVAQGGRRMWLGFAGVLVLMAGDFAAQSRGGLIAMAFAIVVLGFASKQARMRAMAGLIVAGGIVLVILFSAQVQDSTGRDVSGRATENLVALHMFLDHPLTGVGPDQYPFYYRDYTRKFGNDPRYDRAPHSLPLQIAAEQGVVGIIGWIGAAVMLFRFALSTRLWRDPLGRALVTAIGTYCVGSLFLHGSQIRLFYILLGLTLAQGASLVRERAQQPGEAVPA